MIARCYGSGFLRRPLGRRPLLLFAAIVFLGSAYWTGAVDTFIPFLLARFIGGVAIGVTSGMSPMYIAFNIDNFDFF